MKKILIIIPFLLLLFGCANNKGYTELKYEQLKEKIDNKENFALLIGAASCSHCDTFRSTINEINKEYDINIYYVDIDKFNSSEVAYLKAIASFKGTPTTVFITEGKEKSSYNRIDGNRDYEYTVNRLKQNGYIKEVK